MKNLNYAFVFFLGMMAGLGGLGWYLNGSSIKAWASNDRHEDYILCTGQVLVNTQVPSDGVWLLDYRTGRLLGTVIDHTTGSIRGWAEVDLVQEFGLPPRQSVHFLMTTGQVNQTQAALYLTEVNSGKFGVYTMGLRPDGQAGISIKRQDLTTFRPQGEPTKQNLRQTGS